MEGVSLFYLQKGLYEGDAELDGLCGNMDGVIANDWRRCVDGSTCTPNTAGCLKDIATSCIDFSDGNDGAGYKGGTKLDKY